MFDIVTLDHHGQIECRLYGGETLAEAEAAGAYLCRVNGAHSYRVERRNG